MDDESAAFVVVASIGLQGIRLAQPTWVRPLWSQVRADWAADGTIATRARLSSVAIDFDESRLALARVFGAATCNPGAGEDRVTAGMALSRG